MTRVLRAVRRFAAELVRRVRERGRSAVVRAGRITGATVAAFVVAQLLGQRDPPPLIAALTALLVVQATLASTLLNSVQRVISVIAGVALAVLFVSVAGLTWWSLGALVAASILVGQILRLGPHLLEVPISAMLVLGVGFTTGAESIGIGRVLETLIGAAVGVLVNLAFPPAVQTRYAGQAVEKFAGEIAGLLDEAAAASTAGELDVADSARWLEDARRLNRHAPQLDRALAEAEESRTLNLRALGTRKVGGGLRGGLDALEHCSVSVRALFRAVHDATREQIGVEADAGYAAEVRLAAARLMAQLAAVLRAFGRLVRAEVATAGEPEQAELVEALAALRRERAAVEQLMIDDPRGRQGLWTLNSALLTACDRMLVELDVVEHVRLRVVDDGEAAVRARLLARQAVERLRSARHPGGRSPAEPTDPAAPS